MFSPPSPPLPYFSSQEPPSPLVESATTSRGAQEEKKERKKPREHSTWHMDTENTHRDPNIGNQVRQIDWPSHTGLACLLSWRRVQERARHEARWCQLPISEISRVPTLTPRGKTRIASVPSIHPSAHAPVQARTNTSTYVLMHVFFAHPLATYLPMQPACVLPALLVRQ